MECTSHIGIYLDTRRAKRDGTFPVKLRVYDASNQQTSYYSTAYAYSEKDFQSIWQTVKPRREFKEERMKLMALEAKADKVAKDLNPFSFTEFERRFDLRTGVTGSAKYWYDTVIDEFTQRKKISTADTYACSQRCLSMFSEFKGRKYEHLRLRDITKNWLEEFELWLENDQGKSQTTTSIYVRCLRAIFNRAINAKDFPQDQYPFGPSGYQIAATRNVKKSLDTDQLKALFNAKPENEFQEKAKDFWFFSYGANGMNIKDICHLKWVDIIEDDRIEFLRAKTRTTGKKQQKKIVVYLNDYLRSVIEKYSKSDRPDGLIFDILTSVITAKEARIKEKAFTRFINQHIKKLAINNGLSRDISTYWARHSYATTTMRNGKDIAFVSEALGHSDIKTTENYWAGFPDEIKREYARDLMSF